MGDPIQLLSGPGALALVGAGGPVLVGRERLADTIELLIALLDAVEPDPDLEELGAEDSFMLHEYASGPGCIMADSDAAVDDAPCDPEAAI